MKDFSFWEVLGLITKTMPFLLFRFAIYFAITLGFVLITGGPAGRPLSGNRRPAHPDHRRGLCLGDQAGGDRADRHDRADAGVFQGHRRPDRPAGVGGQARVALSQVR